MAHRHFEGYLHAQLYGQYRPVPPVKLIRRIISYLQDRYNGQLNTAYDVGCGSGQSTGFFADFFKNVIGTDVSAEQIKNAQQKNRLPNVSFLVSPAEKFENVPNSSVQLVTACQAAHWFDLPAFYKEAHRVLDTNGVLSFLGYEFPYFITNNADKDRLLRERLLFLYETQLQGYVLPGSVQVYIGKYTDPKFQFGLKSGVFEFGDQGASPGGDKLFRDFTREEGFHEDAATSLNDYIGYCQTWSGFQQYRQLNGDKPANELMDRFRHDLEEIIGHEKSENGSFIKRTNFFLLLGRK